MENGQIPETNKTAKKLSKKQKIIIAIVAILTPILLVGLNFGYRVYSAYGEMYQTIEQIDEERKPFDPGEFVYLEIDEDNMPEDQVEAMWFLDDPYYEFRTAKNPDKLNVLLIGTDALDDRECNLADTIMVVQYDTVTKKAGILSIPRDTYVKIPHRGYDKINHAYGFGGVRLLKDTVEGYLDIHIDYYAQVDLVSFEKIIDVFGGITVDVKHDMIDSRDGTVYLLEGEQVLNGRQAAHYVRQRKLTINPGDFGRIERQQEVLMILLDEITQNKSMMKYLEMLEVLSPYVRTNITPWVVMQYWSDFSKLDSSQVVTTTLEGDGFIFNRIYYYRVPIVDARLAMRQLTTNKPATIHSGISEH